MRDIDSDALTLVQRQLGISGVGESNTTLESEVLQQVFDTVRAVRRARSDIATGGIFYAVTRTENQGADSVAATITPYDVGDQRNTASSWPLVVSNKFDVWLHGVSARVSLNVGNLTHIDCRISGIDRSIGFSDDDSGGGSVVTSTHLNVAHFDTELAADIGGTQIATPAGLLYQPINMRLPRGCVLFSISLAAALSSYDVTWLLGLMPVGMGSDVVHGI